MQYSGVAEVPIAFDGVVGEYIQCNDSMRSYYTRYVHSDEDQFTTTLFHIGYQ